MSALQRAGKRLGTADERGDLFFELARILEAKRPRYFILENVPGLLGIEKGQTFKVILETLVDLGYCVEWLVHDSTSFDVPQSRKRIYLRDYDRAAKFYQLIRYSYASGLDSFGSQPHALWADFPLIDMAARRLQKVIAENKDFEKLIRQYDRPVSFFYCDPPYFATESYYKDVRFTTKDHIRLRDTLLGISGKFLVSYNDCPEIREMWDKPGIYIEEISRINNLAQRYDGGCQYAELLISNYDTSERAKMAKQLSFFDENGGLII